MRGSVRSTVGGGGVSESSLLEGVCAVERQETEVGRISKVGSKLWILRRFYEIYEAG